MHPWAPGVEIDWTGTGSLATTWRTGPVTFVVEDPVGGGDRVTVDLPDPPGAVLTVPVDLRGTERVLTVLGPDRTPVAGAWVSTGGPYGDHTSKHGTISSWTLRDGAALRIELDEETLPLHVRLAGEGPYEAVVPGGEVLVRVPGADRVVALVDGHLLEAEGEALPIRGVRPGSARLIVAAPGREAREVRVEVPAGRVRRLVLDLPPLSR